MKKSIIIFLSVLAISLTFSGCGESEGSVSSSNNGGPGVDIGQEDIIIDNGDVTDTVAKMPYVLSDELGTPPGIPAD